MEKRINVSAEVEYEDDADLAASHISPIVRFNDEMRMKLARTDRAPADAVKEIRHHTCQVVRVNGEGKMRLPLNYFTHLGDHVTRHSVDVILGQSKFGCALLEELEKLGTEARITGVKVSSNVFAYKRAYRFLIAGLVMSTSGMLKPEDLDEGIVVSWLNFYAGAGGARFNRADLWGKRYDVFSKCLKEIAKSLGAMLGSHSISRYGKIQRGAGQSDSRQGAASASAKTIMDVPPPKLKAWRELYDRWRSEVRPVSRPPYAAVGRLLLYLDMQPDDLVCDPQRFLEPDRKRVE
ncbi:hypothetical protein [Rhizobium leguminosarum]|uniref:hypothetical protein n=1 Tax=Rhizobium leguminosarum TaxID=384 RepID=UPI001AE4E9AA|nr:hypothetical protein [Rhizobium leguminosarum]MBP2443437.1 hypothetical protein [Rhizobium leguminosarum]